MSRHIDIIKKFGYNTIVVLNKFDSDTNNELNAVKEFCHEYGDIKTTINNGYMEGSDGALDFAQTVIDNIDKHMPFYTYELEYDTPTKIKSIVDRVYMGNNVIYSGAARDKIENINGDYYVCMAKTQYSLSGDTNKDSEIGQFDIIINDIEIANGARFVIPIVGDMLRMPGLPMTPNAEEIDLLDDDRVVGLK